MSAVPMLDPRQAFPHLFPPAAGSSSTISSHSSILSSGHPSSSSLDGLPSHSLRQQPSALHPTNPLSQPANGLLSAMPPPNESLASRSGAMLAPAPPSSPVDQIRLPPTKAAELARFEVLETLGTFSSSSSSGHCFCACQGRPQTDRCWRPLLPSTCLSQRDRDVRSRPSRPSALAINSADSSPSDLCADIVIVILISLAA